MKKIVTALIGILMALMIAMPVKVRRLLGWYESGDMRAAFHRTHNGHPSLYNSYTYDVLRMAYDTGEVLTFSLRSTPLNIFEDLVESGLLNKTSSTRYEPVPGKTAAALAEFDTPWRSNVKRAVRAVGLSVSKAVWLFIGALIVVAVSRMLS